MLPSQGGETFFPRALNADGKEYHPWNGDHEDCYRGLYVPPVRGNAVLFYSMVRGPRRCKISLPPHDGIRVSCTWSPATEWRMLVYAPSHPGA